MYFSVFRLLDSLPKSNRNLIHSLFGLLEKIAKHSSNYMTASKLSSCIAPSLFWLKESTIFKRIKAHKRKVILCLTDMLCGYCFHFASGILHPTSERPFLNVHEDIPLEGTVTYLSGCCEQVGNKARYWDKELIISHPIIRPQTV